MRRQPLKILIVDDCSEDRAKLRRFLEQEEGYEYQFAEEEFGKKAIKTCFEFQPDCVLLDSRPPDSDISEVLSAINSSATEPLFPIILLADADDEIPFETAVRFGVRNCLVKSEFSASTLRRAVHLAVETVRFRHYRKENDEGLTESELRYQTLARISPYAIFINTGGVISYANDECVKLFGASRKEEIIGKSPFDFIHPDFHETVRGRIAAMKQNHPIAPVIEQKMIRLDGNVVDVEASAAKFIENGGESILVTVRDIRERKETESKLRESQWQTHLALEAANTIAFTWDIKSDVVRRLHSGVAVLPETESDTMAGVVRKIFEADRQKFLDNLKASVANPRETYRAEYRLMMPDGKISWLSEVGRFETDENGEAVRLTGISAEITERKIAEEQLRASEARLHLGFEVADFAVCQVNYLNGTIHLSKEAARLFDLGSEEMTVAREAVHATFHPDDAAELKRQIAQALIPDGDGWFALEHRIIRKNGEVRWLNVRKQIYFDHSAGPPRATIGILAAQDITERKTAEEELRASEEFNRTVLENSPDCVELLDALGRLQYVNANGLSLMEIDDFKKVKNKNWWELWQPETQPIVKDSVERSLRGETVQFQASCPTAKGTPKWWDVIISPVVGKDGKTERIISVSRDITERKTAEEEIRQNESRFKQLANSLPQLVWTCKPDGPCDFLSRQWLDYTGIPEEEQLGFGWLEQVHPDDREPTIKAWSKAVEEGTDFQTEFRIRRYDGVYRPFDTRAVRLYDDEGKTIKWFGTNTDITERKESEEKLRKSEERFRLLTENLDSVFWIFDWQEKRGEYVSPAFNRLYGRDHAESLSVEFKNWTDVIHEEDRERAKNDFLSIEQTGKYESTYRIVLPDGAIRWRHAKGSPIRGEAGEILRVVGVTEDITDRIQAETQIRESEERLRLATDTAEMFSWEIDLTAQIIKWAGNAAKIIGCSPSDIRNKLDDAMFFVLPEDREKISQAYEKASHKGKNSYVVEFRGIRENQFWQAHGLIVRDASGNPVKIIGVTQDITARKQAEEKIQTANYRFRVAEEAAKGFNYEWSLETGVVTRSEAIKGVLGFAREEIPTTWQAWADLIHPDDIKVESETEAREFLAALKQETFSSEYRARHKDGHYIWLMERGLLIRDGEGNLRRVIGQTMDITAQKEAQEKLLEAERRAVSDYRKLLARIAPLAQTLGTARELTTIYRSLLDFIRLEIPCEGFFVSFYDAENQLKQVKYVWSEGAEIDARAMQPIPLFKTQGANSRALREGKSIFSTRNLEKMNGQFQVVSETNEKTVESLVTPMIVMGRAIGTLEVQNHREKYAQEHIVALEMAANLAAVAIENVRLIDIESEARAAAEEANRAKDEFLAMLSHELRSPLNAIFGWTQILQNTNPNAEQTAKAVEIIARNVRLQKTLIEDLLDVSRIISGKMQLENENVSLISIVQEAVDAARPAAEKQKVGIEMNLNAAMDEIYGDRHRLQQIVGNLLTNAVKFTPNEGKIRLSLVNEGAKIRLTIEDTGIGIEPALLPHIFDRFRQADGGYKRKYGGLGIGLTIVKHLAELHGGTVSAFSEGAGKGARFTVEFPLVPQYFYAPDAGASSAESAQMLSKKLRSLDGARILTVDDDRDVLDLISFVLREAGATVTCCESAREALEYLRRGAFDLLISDLGMSEMDGFELIKAMREAENGDRRIPAVALTGFVSAQDRKRVMDAGFQKHLSKPVDLDKLLTIAVGLIKKTSDENI